MTGFRIWWCIFVILWFPLSDLNLFTYYNLTLLKLLQSYYHTSRHFTVPFDLECNFGKKRNQKRITIKFLYLVCLILQYAVKKACLSLNPVVLFFFVFVFFFTWLCGLGKGSVPIRLVQIINRGFGVPCKTTQVEYDKLHLETFMWYVCAHVKVPVSTFSNAASRDPSRPPPPT